MKKIRKIYFLKLSRFAHFSVPLFGKIFDPARDGVRKVLKSDIAEIFIFAATLAGGWGATLSNTVASGNKILAARKGMFSHR